MSIEVRHCRPGEAEASEELVARAFGPGRFAKSAYRLREGVQPQTNLFFVAVDDSGVVGTIQFWPISIGATPALLLGPLATDPTIRGQGIGLQLMRHGLEAARKAGHRVVILVGDEPYYAKVGFQKLKPRAIRMPGPVNPMRLLGLALIDGALDGLEGEVLRAQINDAPCAAGAGLSALRPAKP